VTTYYFVFQTDLERARFLLSEALDEDEKGDVDMAIELYSSAVELCLKIVSVISTLPQLEFYIMYTF
jgi:hypothetical protein